MVMMINELNTGLIEALKEKLPPKTNLANLLIGYPLYWQRSHL